MTPFQTKQSFLDYFHSKLPPQIEEISSSRESHQNKAKRVNKLISDHRDFLAAKIDTAAAATLRQEKLIILQYAVSVVSLEYRHAVWPYEYMALSRRVGELWERFCSAAWDIPSRQKVERITPPNFPDVLAEIEASLLDYSQDEKRESAAEILGSVPTKGFIFPVACDSFPAKQQTGVG